MIKHWSIAHLHIGQGRFSKMVALQKNPPKAVVLNSYSTGKKPGDLKCFKLKS